MYCEGQWVINFIALKLNILLLQCIIRKLKQPPHQYQQECKKKTKQNDRSNKQKQSLCTFTIYLFVVVWEWELATVNISYSFFCWMSFQLIHFQESSPHCTKLQGSSNNVNIQCIIIFMWWFSFEWSWPLLKFPITVRASRHCTSGYQKNVQQSVQMGINNNGMNNKP